MKQKVLKGVNVNVKCVKELHNENCNKKIIKREKMLIFPNEKMLNGTWFPYIIYSYFDTSCFNFDKIDSIEFSKFL